MEPQKRLRRSAPLAAQELVGAGRVVFDFTGGSLTLRSSLRYPDQRTPAIIAALWRLHTSSCGPEVIDYDPCLPARDAAVEHFSRHRFDAESFDTWTADGAPVSGLRIDAERYVVKP